VAAALELGEKELMYEVPNLIGKPGIYCNLGELYGGSSILMALSIKNSGLNAKVYTVDCDKNALAQSKNNYVRHGVENFIVQYEGTTDAWSGMFRNRGEKFQFVVIAADHSFKHTRNDILNYRPLIEPGGLLGFHDTNQDGVNQAIEQAKVDWELVEWVNRIKLFRKP